MWTPLQHPYQIEFYEDAHRGGSAPGEGWLPMVRAVQYLQSRDYARSLFAFTSLYKFQVTTAPSYVQCRWHHFVGVLWYFPRQQFRLFYYTQSWASEQPPECVCTEVEFPAAVEPLIKRLLLQSPQPPDTRTT